MTWEYGGTVTWVDVHLLPSDDGTSLRLEHTALVGGVGDQWDEFGPGAVGVGWDMCLLGLADHLTTGAPVVADPGDAAGLELMEASSEAWGRASVAYGTPVAAAVAAAARTTAAYTGN